MLTSKAKEGIIAQPNNNNYELYLYRLPNFNTTYKNYE